jgi:hypothetical protein
MGMASELVVQPAPGAVIARLAQAKVSDRALRQCAPIDSDQGQR